MSEDLRIGNGAEPQAPDAPRSEQGGSALVMAVFVLVLLTGMGGALLFLTQNELKMTEAGIRNKKAFFLAESGIEDARSSLWDTNGNGTFDDDLVAAAGPDGVIDFDPALLEPVRDTNGNVTGFTGYNDDVPLVSTKAIGEGWYITFLTNDPVDGRGNLADSNDRVMLAGVGAGADNSFETVHAIIELDIVVPSIPPATITMLGPTPLFNSGNSKVKLYEGEDCAGSGMPNLYMPVVGTVGSAEELAAEGGVQGNPTFQSGPYVDDEVINDLTDTSDPLVSVDISTTDWTDCESMRDVVEELRLIRDVTCADGTTLGNTCPIGAMTSDMIIFGEGDLTVPPGPHSGMLVVTGRLEMHGNTDWNGYIMVVGQGEFYLSGAGNGIISGGMVVADISGPDNIYPTGDDCTGGTNGFADTLYDEQGGGNAGIMYCSMDLISSIPAHPYQVVSFRQE